MIGEVYDSAWSTRLTRMGDQPMRLGHLHTTAEPRRVMALHERP
jgi:hypothetical protein